MTRIPFSKPSEDPEYVATSHARVKCENCGEWIYAVRRNGVGPAFIPSNCVVCGSASLLLDQAEAIE